MRHMLISSVLLGMIMFMPQQAESQNPRQLAAQHTSRGDQAHAQRQYNAALAEYVLAYAYDAAPERLLNVGRAYEGLGNRSAAIELYNRVVALGRRGPAVDAANARIAALGGGGGPVAVTGGGTLTVMTIPPGGEIWVDGTKRGASPMAPVSLTPGPHAVEIRLTGYQTWTKSITVTSGQQVSEMANLMVASSTAGTAAQPQTLTVNNIPAGGQLTLNGRTVQITGPTAAAKVLPGQYTVVVKRIGMPDFVQIIRVAAGQNPVVNVTVAGAARPVGLPAPTSVSGHSTLAGQWFGVMMSPPSPFENNRSVTLNLAGSGSRLSGKLVVRSSVKLKGYKRRQCNGAEGANWETTYQASFVQMPGGGVIRGSGGIQTSCSCSAMCSTSNEVSFDVFVSPTKTVMAGEDLLWQRQTGATAPARATMSRIDPSKLGGAWHVRSGNVKQDTQSPMTLQVSGNGVSGTTSITATNSLGWRKRECNGQSEMTANYNFAVSGEVVGGVAAISFAKGSPAYSDCPCKASVCSAMAGGMRLGSQKFKMSLDGNHLIGNGMLLSRK